MKTREEFNGFHSLDAGGFRVRLDLLDWGFGRRAERFGFWNCGNAVGICSGKGNRVSSSL